MTCHSQYNISKDNETVTAPPRWAFVLPLPSPAHQQYNFLQKSCLATWYSIENVYQIIQHEPVQSHLHVSVGRVGGREDVSV